jgi:hypothetical protein
MNMRIAKLSMDAQDKSRFEIQGKSSVKYHLKANHTVEAKRWFWALNNAIQYAKDEARQEEMQKQRPEQVGRPDQSNDGSGAESSRFSAKGLTPATALSVPSLNASRVSFKSTFTGASSVVGDDYGSTHESYDGGVAPNDNNSVANPTTLVGDVDDDEEYGDDASSHEMQPASKDAFNITAHSASLQLELLEQVSKALKAQATAKHDTRISDPVIATALDTYEDAVQSLQTMVGDLLRIARDRDAYWQYRLEREADLRRLWEDSMAKVAREQEELEGRLGESEGKRKRTKRALRDALEAEAQDEPLLQAPAVQPLAEQQFQESSGVSEEIVPPIRRRSTLKLGGRRRSTIVAFTDLSDSDSDEDEEFFDAIGAGEVEVVNAMPTSPPPPAQLSTDGASERSARDVKAAELVPSYKGYEGGVRTRLKMDEDNRPKISLWVWMTLLLIYNY